MTEGFIRTNTILDKILAHKEEEIVASKGKLPLSTMQAMVRDADTPRDMLIALQKNTVALIAEVKKASPSKGVLIEDFHPVKIGKTYEENGAAAISVLTDEAFFQGGLNYLQDVRQAVGVPCLRKDFIIDPYQVYEARVALADAVLLIVAALSDEQLQSLYECIMSLGMTPLVEVHNETEIQRALQVGAKLIGINNRDLNTFTVDLETTERLAKLVPDDVVLVAESGIKSAEDVYKIGQLGADAVLVGESLVKSENMPATVAAYSRQHKKKTG